MQFDYIRNGVDIKKYKYADSKVKVRKKDELNLPRNKVIIAYSGQFIDRKDQAFAIEGILASGYADKICMVLMGSGPNFDTLVKKYENDSRLIFTGNINNVNEYLQASDLYVSSSKSEGMPNGVLEAMASGLPVLLSNIPQHMEVLEVNKQFGLSYQLSDMQDYIAKFEDIMEMDLGKMGEIAAQVALKDFSAQSMSDKYQEFYRNLLVKKMESI